MDQLSVTKRAIEIGVSAGLLGCIVFSCSPEPAPEPPVESPPGTSGSTGWGGTPAYLTDCEDIEVPLECSSGTGQLPECDETLEQVDLGECSFEDAQLELTVRAAVLKNGGGTPVCLQSLRIETEGEADATHPVSNLAGISCLTSLVELQIHSGVDLSEQVSLEPVAALTALDSLLLTGINLVDHEALGGLRPSRLGIFQTDLTSVPFVASMTSLTQLSLTGDLVDIDAVGNLVDLDRLWIVAENLESIDALSSLSALTDVSLQSCFALQDIEGLANSTQLTRLSLEGTPITSLAGIRNAHELRTLSLRDSTFGNPGPQLESLEGLEDHHQLTINSPSSRLAPARSPPSLRSKGSRVSRS